MSKNKIKSTDCTSQCKSRSHGKLLTSAISKWSVSDEKLACFIKASCANFHKAFDYEGRTPLHIAASRGRVALMDWIARHSSDAFLNARDRESGFTPLHRAVYYGQIHAAVHLMMIGAKPDILDKEGYRPVDHAMLDRPRASKQMDIDLWGNINDIPHSGPVPGKNQWGPDSHRIHKGGVRDFRKMLSERPRWGHSLRPGLDQPYEVYMWGSNSNYTLGTGTQQQRNLPDLLTFFNRANACITQILLGKFHSVWLCGSGEVWCCGQLARAGGPNVTTLTPTLLKLPVLQWRCIAVAITLNSTILLLDNGAVLQYALNTSDNTSQSSTKAPTSIKLPSIRPILRFSVCDDDSDDVTDEPSMQYYGITSSRNHVVVWAYGNAYSWGENVGQLGHAAEYNKEKVVTAPQKVVISRMDEGKRIECVAVSDAATVLTTSHGDVFLIHNYFYRKIAHKLLNVVQVCVDAKVSENGVYSRVTVLLLTNLGEIKLWQDTTNTLTRCVFGLPHQILVGHIALTHDFVYFTTNHGEAYTATISRKAPNAPNTPKTPLKNNRSLDKPLVKFLEKGDCTHVKITRIPNIHRAVSIHVDNEGLNFGCLQTKPTCGMQSYIRASRSCFDKHMDILRDSASTDDPLHDVIFKVGTKLFPAHIYIVASRSDYLYNLYKQKRATSDEKPEIVLNHVHPEVFERILKFIYTGTCDVAREGSCDLKVKREELTELKNDDNAEPEFPALISAAEVYKKRQRPRRNVEADVRYTHYDPVRMVQAAAKRMHVMSLHKLLDNYVYKDGLVREKASATYVKPPLPFDREAFPDLVDTIVVSKEGIEVPAHKCMLASRLEYFHGMYMHSWAESKTKSKVNIPVRHNILMPILNFIYTDKCPEVQKSDNMDFICNMLVIADQLLISRLKEMSEIALSDMINLKNCAEICTFAYTYNAENLKYHAMEFISLNLCNLLENGALEVLEQPVLQQITETYRKLNPVMSMRYITPYSDAPSDEVIEEYAKKFPINMDVTDYDYKKEDGTPEHGRKKGNKKIAYTESEKERKLYESVSSVTSLDVSNDTIDDVSLSLNKINSKSENATPEKSNKWIEIPTSQQKQQKVVQARLKAIQTAKDIMMSEVQEDWSKLTKGNSRMSESPQEPIAELSRSLQGNLVISHVGPKLSQKQRKKLAKKGKSHGKRTSIDDSLSDEDFGPSPSEVPKNPWNIIKPQVESASSKPKDIEFNKILTDQKKQKEDHSRIMTKPLVMTQLEDKAIEQLEKFYNVHGIDDEWITVRRIALQVSSPQWIHTGPK